MKLWFPIAAGILSISPLSRPVFAEATTTLVSVTFDGTPANNQSGHWSVALSADGRYVVFGSDASNLIPGDTNGVSDTFLRDIVAGTTTRISVASDGTQGNGKSSDSNAPAISADGRYVAFQSSATNLVPDDTNGAPDVFVRDTVAGTTTRVSVASDGSQASIGGSYPSISADGRYVAFASSSPDLVPGDTNGFLDVFVHDTVSGTTTRVSVATDGAQGNQESFQPAISADGMHVAFSSGARNLVPGDTNATDDIYVRDLTAGTTTRVTVSTDGVQANGLSRSSAISADGRYVTFYSDATNLVPHDTNSCRDVFVRDMLLGATTLGSAPYAGTRYGACALPSINANGRYIAFTSLLSPLLTTEVFVRDMLEAKTTCVSVAANGTQANGFCGYPAVSADGRYVAFTSSATNLAAGDTNSNEDVFVRGPLFTPYSVGDAERCMRIASGLATPSAAEVARFRATPGSGSVSLADAVHIARKAAGLEANP